MQSSNRFWFVLLLIFLITLAIPLMGGEKKGGDMTEEVDKYTEEECQKRFAVQFNNFVWTLLAKQARTEEESEDMVNAAHASLFHWSKIGTPLNLQRGEWLISHVYAVLNRAEPALYHAQRCMVLTDKHKFVDFDLAYAYEAMARAYAVAGNESGAKNYLGLAREAGQKIKNEEDRELFFSDFETGPWYGMK